MTVRDKVILGIDYLEKENLFLWKNDEGRVFIEYDRYLRHEKECKTVGGLERFNSLGDIICTLLSWANVNVKRANNPGAQYRLQSLRLTEDNKLFVMLVSRTLGEARLFLFRSPYSLTVLGQLIKNFWGENDVTNNSTKGGM